MPNLRTRQRCCQGRTTSPTAKFFRTGKFSSFQRQLNNFGFHKAPHLSTSKLRVYLREDLQGYPAESVLALRRGQKRGVAPDAVLGHSLGELAAACSGNGEGAKCGPLSRREAARIVAIRAALMAEHAVEGGMTAGAIH